MGLHLCTYACAPAEGINCSKAATKIEKAICTDKALLQVDADLAATYNEIVSVRSNALLTDAEKRLLSAEQSHWLGDREKSCGLLSQEKHKACIGQMTSNRRDQLKLEWGDDPKELTKSSMHVGSEIITRKDNPYTGEFTLTYKGKEIYTGGTGGTYEVQRAFTSDVITAIVLAIGGGYNGTCGEYVLFSTSGGEVTSDVLDEYCLSETLQNNPVVERTANGFTSTLAASPRMKGHVVMWDVKVGKSVKERAFAPVPKTKMDAFFSAKQSGALLVPAENEEFYNTVKAMAGKDADRIIWALWQPTGGCDGCNDTPDPMHFGAKVEVDKVVFSGCSYGDGMKCGATDALAVFTKSPRALFFAVDAHSADAKHSASQVTFYPKQEEWPLAVREILTHWMDGTLKPEAE